MSKQENVYQTCPLFPLAHLHYLECQKVGFLWQNRWAACFDSKTVLNCILTLDCFCFFFLTNVSETFFKISKIAGFLSGNFVVWTFFLCACWIERMNGLQWTVWAYLKKVEGTNAALEERYFEATCLFLLTLLTLILCVYLFLLTIFYLVGLSALSTMVHGRVCSARITSKVPILLHIFFSSPPCFVGHVCLFFSFGLLLLPFVLRPVFVEHFHYLIDFLAYACFF